MAFLNSESLRLLLILQDNWTKSPERVFEEQPLSIVRDAVEQAQLEDRKTIKREWLNAAMEEPVNPVLARILRDFKYGDKPDLSGSNLAGQNFREADLTGWKLNNADFCHTDLTDARMDGEAFVKAVEDGRMQSATTMGLVLCKDGREMAPDGVARLFQASIDNINSHDIRPERSAQFHPVAAGHNEFTGSVIQPAAE